MSHSQKVICLAAPRAVRYHAVMTTASNVGRISQRRKGPSVGRPGQLDRYDDGTWEFFGNDKTTSEQVAENIIKFEKDKGNSEYNLLRGDTLAQMLLDSPDNKKLRDKVQGDPRRAIPKNSSFLAEAPTLKQCVTLLAKHEQHLRTSLTQHNSSGSNKTLGTVRSAGLSLPYDPSEADE